jgi:hypothetical protein
MTKRVLRVQLLRSPLQVQGRLALSNSGQVETLVDSRETRFQQMSDALQPAATETSWGDLCKRVSPQTEQKLTSPSEVLQATTRLEVSKTPGPNGIPNRVQGHTKARDNRSNKHVQCSPSRAVLPTSAETNSRGIHIDDEKRPYAAFFLLTHEPTWHSWQAFRDPSH